MKSLSHVQLLVTPWTAAYQAPPSMGFSRQELLGQANNVNKLEAKMLRLHINQKAHSSVSQRNLFIFFFLIQFSLRLYPLFLFLTKTEISFFLTPLQENNNTNTMIKVNRSLSTILPACQRLPEFSPIYSSVCYPLWLVASTQNAGPVMPNIPIFQEKPNI